ncbi:type 4a pilus biogenesis protein PilO [Desulfococcus sp.]|uniref:type 4a pilus biogenesis protein PilO n=1 Tax=Desulfococcus sp. TaxID=2025834 RepID=UPI003592FE1B
MNTIGPPSLAFIEPYLEKIGKFSKTQRIVICLVTLALIIAPVIYFVYIPKHDKISGLRKEYEGLSTELAQFKQKAKELNKYRAEAKAIEADFDNARMALPESEEIPSLLKGISRAGQDAGLVFLQFKPQREKQFGFYAEIPVSMTFKGSYHEVLDFFYRVSSLSRIVSIRDIEIHATNERKRKGNIDWKELDVSCSSVTYKFVDKQPQPSIETKKK